MEVGESAQFNEVWHPGLELGTYRFNAGPYRCKIARNSTTRSQPLVVAVRVG